MSVFNVTAINKIVLVVFAFTHVHYDNSAKYIQYMYE